MRAVTVWNQPGPVTVGAPQPAQGAHGDGLPSLKAPRIVTIVGVAMLLLGIALLLIAVQTAPSVLDKNAVEVDRDGTVAPLILLEDTEYGLYSDDPDIACTVSDPTGTVLDVYPPGYKSGEPPQALGFRSTDAGTYEVACTGDSAITINVASISPEWDRVSRLALVALPFSVLGAAVAAGGATWLVVRRRARSRAVVSRLFTAGPAGAPGFQPFPAVDQSAFPPAAGAAPGAYGPTQPTAAPATPLPPSPPPVTPPTSAPPQNSYGFAPQQVVYRPLPPPEGQQEP